MENVSDMIPTDRFIRENLDSEEMLDPRQLRDEGRYLECDLAERIARSKDCLDKCERRVQQLQKAIESDLFQELDVDLLERLRVSARLRPSRRPAPPEPLWPA